MRSSLAAWTTYLAVESTATPAGPISKPLANMQTLLANLAACQTWLDVADVTEALGKLYLVAADDPADDPLPTPYAVVMQGERGCWAGRRTAGGAAARFAGSGVIDVLFVADVAASLSYADAELTFTNEVGAILSEIDGVAGSNEYLNVTGMRVLWGPTREDTRAEDTGEAPNDVDDAPGTRLQIMVQFTWGI